MFDLNRNLALKLPKKAFMSVLRYQGTYKEVQMFKINLEIQLRQLLSENSQISVAEPLVSQ